MSIKAKSFHLLLNQIILTGSQVVLLICASYWLDMAEYGVYRQFLLIAETFTPIFGIGFSVSIYYFLTKYSDHNRLLFKIIKYGVIITLIMSIMSISHIASFIANALNSPDLIGLLIYAAPYITMMILLPILHAFYVYNNKTKQLFFLNSSLAIIYLVLTAAILYYNRSALFLVWSRTLYLLITCITLSVVFYKWAKSNQKEKDEKYNLKDLFVYSLPIGAASVVGIISMQINKFIVSTNYSVKDFAIYSNGAFEIPFIGLITSTITVVSLSELIKLCEADKYLDALRLFHKIAIVSALFLFPISIFFFTYSDDFILLMFGSKYAGSAILFRVFLFLVPIRIIVYGPVLIALDKRHVLLYRSIWELIINVILSFFLMYFIGLIGIAISNVISVALWSVPFNLYHINRGFQCAVRNLLPYKKLGIIGLISFGGIIPVLLIDSLMSWSGFVRLVSSSSLYLIFIGIGFLKFNFVSFSNVKSLLR